MNDSIYSYKDFVNLVLESESNDELNLNADFSKVNSKWKDLYFLYDTLCKSYSINPGWLTSGGKAQMRAQDHPLEFIRFRFGDKSTFGEITKSIIERYFLKSADDINNVEISEPEMRKHITGSTYESIEITIPINLIKDDVLNKLQSDNKKHYKQSSDGNSILLYFTNQNKVSKTGGVTTIVKKMLEPDKILNISSKYNISTLTSNVINGLDNNIKCDNSVKDLLKGIIHNCQKFGNENQKNDIVDIINDFEKGVTFDIENIDCSIINDDDIKNISNDFGEILGPIILLSMLNGGVLKYPSANTSLYDYYISLGDDTDPLSYYKISHKSDKGGAPSLLTYFLEIQSKYNDVKDSLDSNMKECFENVIEPMCMYTYTSALYNIYEKICNDKNVMSFFNYVFKTKNVVDFNSARESSSASAKENKHIAESILNKFNENKEEYLEKYENFIKDINYTFKKGTIEDAIYLIENGDNGQKVGTIFVPIELAVKREIQNKYWDIINKLIGDIATGKQCYATLKLQKSTNKMTLNFKLVHMKGGNYEMRTKGYLTKSSRGLNGNIGVGLIA